MAMLMAYPELPPPLVDSVLVSTAPIWTRPWWLLISPLTLYLWGTRRMPTSFLCSPVKIGWHSWMIICPVRPLSLVKFSVSPPCNLKTQHVSRYWSGSGLILFLLKPLCPELRFLWHHKNIFFSGCEWCSEEETEFRSISTTITGTKTRTRTVVLGLSRLTDWRSYRPESHLSLIESVVLLVGYG